MQDDEQIERDERAGEERLWHKLLAACLLWLALMGVIAWLIRHVGAFG